MRIHTQVYSGSSRSTTLYKALSRGEYTEHNTNNILNILLFFRFVVSKPASCSGQTQLLWKIITQQPSLHRSPGLSKISQTTLQTVHMYKSALVPQPFQTQRRSDALPGSGPSPDICPLDWLMLSWSNWRWWLFPCCRLERGMSSGRRLRMGIAEHWRAAYH